MNSDRPIFSGSLITLITCLVITPAAAQSLDQTLDKIGTTLEQTQKAISATSTPAPPKNNATAPPKMGQTVTMPYEATVFSSPNENKPTSMKLPQGAAVVYQGTENGFAKIKAAGATTSVFVPDSTLHMGTANFLWNTGGSTSIGGAVNTAVDGEIKRAMNTVKALAHELESNPYVRLKGFSVNVAVLPSMNVEFEMKPQSTQSGSPAKKP
jgi:hypothetical protein